MKKITFSNLQNAFAGESQASIRYKVFADRAMKDGFHNVARVFEAASASEQIHAGNHLKALDGIQETSSNLAAASGGEEFEINEMYPAYIAVAMQQGEKKVERTMNWALQAEKIHFDLFQKAAAGLAAGKDIDKSGYSVCPFCGFTMEGDAPEVCPVCGAKRETFIKI
jgi:rubrerythrin